MMKKAYKSFMILLIAVIMLMMSSCSSSDNNNSTGQTAATVETSQDDKPSYQQNQNHNGYSEHEQHQNSNHDIIGIEKAKQIALDKVSGATVSDITEIEEDHDHGRIEYEGSIFYNGYEYEFEIDGKTGNIIKWEIDD